MTEQQFCYWLQGYFELGQATELNTDQVQVIKDHLQLVFKKETPTQSTKIIRTELPSGIKPEEAPDVPYDFTRVTC